MVMSNLQAVEKLVHRPLAEHGIPLDTTTTRDDDQRGQSSTHPRQKGARLK